MKNYIPIQLFFVSSIIMAIVLTIRCQFSGLFVCLILNIMECLISLVLIKRKVTLVIVIHKLSNIALITSFFF